jgi:hypothetical protein
MSWKPCRGGRVALDKAVKDRHEQYFNFYMSVRFIDKCKAAFKWMKAEKYFTGAYQFGIFDQSFIDECRANPKTYKPLLRIFKEAGI